MLFVSVFNYSFNKQEVLLIGCCPGPIEVGLIGRIDGGRVEEVHALANTGCVFNTGS